MTEEKLTITECAKEMRVSPRTALRMFRHMPGVLVTHTPGSVKKPIIRVPRKILEGVLRRAERP